MLELRQTCGMRAMDERDGFDELDQGGGIAEIDEIEKIEEMNLIDSILERIDFWEELVSLPWEVQQECERRYPEVVRRLELGFNTEMRFPIRD